MESLKYWIIAFSFPNLQLARSAFAELKGLLFASSHQSYYAVVVLENKGPVTFAFGPNELADYLRQKIVSICSNGRLVDLSDEEEKLLLGVGAQRFYTGSIHYSSEAKEE